MTPKMQLQFLSMLMVITLVSACATLPKPQAAAPVAGASLDTPEESESVPAQQTEPQDTYSLGPDDVIRIVVEQHSEWSGEFTVRPDGNIFIPGMGEFRMQGLTKQTAAIALSSHLERFINNPRVAVEIVRYASQAIYVLGEVERPGKYSTEGKSITLRDAIIMAGLPRRFAATGRVYVINPSYTGKPRQKVVNLDRVLKRGELRNNLALNPGDVVYVPQTVLGMLSDFVSAILSPFSSAYTSSRPMLYPVP